MTVFAAPPRVVTSRTPFLLAVTGDNARIQIQSPCLGRDTLPEPAKEMREDFVVLLLPKSSEKTRERRNTSHFTQTKDSAQDFIETDQRGMSKACAASPHRHQESLDDEHRIYSAVASGLWQRCGSQRALPIDPTEHFVHEPQSTPSRESLVRKAPRQASRFSNFFVHPASLTRFNAEQPARSPFSKAGQPPNAIFGLKQCPQESLPDSARS